MAIINCPECNREISDAAKSCPQCGYELKPQKPEGKTNLLKVGAIINIVGGLAFWIVLFAMNYLMSTTSSSSSTSGGINIQVEVDGGAMAPTLIAASLIILIVITVLSIILVLPINFRRTPAVIITVIQLALSVLALIFFFVGFNIAICCGGWLYTWGSMLQLVGSIICLIGALKIND